MLEEDDHYYRQCPVAEGKKDRRGLVEELPRALRFVAWHLSRGRRVLVHCAQGKDRSAAVAVAVLASFFDEKGQFLERRLARIGGVAGGASDNASNGGRDEDAAGGCFSGRRRNDTSGEEGTNESGGNDTELRAEVHLGVELTKPTITRCLHWVALARPVVAPTRHTLKKLHRFFSGVD